jgi:DNA-binding transcriptional MerR regulator
VEGLKVKHLAQLIDRLTLACALQLQRFREIREIACRQYDLIASGRGDQLGETLAQRQQLMEKIEEICVEITEIQDEIKQLLHLKEFDLKKVEEFLTTTSSSPLQEILNNLGSAIAEIQEIDAKNTALLRSQLQSIKDDMKRLRDLRQANTSYTNKGSSRSTRLDTKK